MRAEHAALLANAVRAHLWDDLEVCSPGGGWITVRGEVQQGGVEQRIEEFSNGFVAKAETLHLDPLDFAPHTVRARPDKTWWVRYKDVGGRVELRRLAEPMTLQDSGRFMTAPLKPRDPADAVPA